MQMNQVAIAYTNEAERDAIKASLGLTNADWVKDTVTSVVKVLGRHGETVDAINTAELEFCMAMGGTQFELIRYTDGPNWIAEASRLGVAMPMVAHVGFHLEEGEDWPPIANGGVLAQEAITVEHSNPAVNEVGRRYHYRIYRVGLSAYFKFIKRLTVGRDAHGVVEGLELHQSTVQDAPLQDTLRNISADLMQGKPVPSVAEQLGQLADEPASTEEAPSADAAAIDAVKAEQAKATVEVDAAQGKSVADEAAKLPAETAEPTGAAGKVSELTATEAETAGAEADGAAASTDTTTQGE